MQPQTTNDGTEDDGSTGGEDLNETGTETRRYVRRIRNEVENTEQDLATGQFVDFQEEPETKTITDIHRNEVKNTEQDGANGTFDDFQNETEAKTMVDIHRTRNEDENTEQDKVTVGDDNILMRSKGDDTESDTVCPDRISTAF